MKPFIIASALLITTFSLQAQTEKGRFMLGLHNFAPVLSENSGILSPTNSFGIGFGTSTLEADGFEFEDKYFNFGLNGSAHYFIIDDLSAGINLNFFNAKVTDEDDDEFSTNIILAGPELRYYFNVGSSSKVYLKGNAAWGSLNNKFNGEDDETPSTLSQYGGGVGFAIFPANNFSINIGASYNSFLEKFELESGDVTNSTNGLAIDLGFSIFLGGTE